MDKVERKIKKESLLFDLEYNFVVQFIKLRKKLKLSQEALAAKSGILRVNVARIETQMVSPQLNTLIKILAPIGYTVKIVPIKEVEPKE